MAPAYGRRNAPDIPTTEVVLGNARVAHSNVERAVERPTLRESHRKVIDHAALRGNFRKVQTFRVGRDLFESLCIGASERQSSVTESYSIKGSRGLPLASLGRGTVVLAESWPNGILIRDARQAAGEALRPEWIDAVNREFAEFRKDGEQWSVYQDELCAWDCILADGLPVESA